VQNWRARPLLKEPLIYVAAVLAIAFAIFVIVSVWSAT
jgi:hypothetical protein